MQTGRTDGRTPKQERSRHTQERTLQAVEQLLTHKPFEQISIAEIVASADSSVGSFYARFGSKEGLLPHLYRRYDADLYKRLDAALADVEGRPRSLVDQVRWFVDTHVTMCRRRRWLLRAVGLYARAEPQPLSGALLMRRGQLHRRITQTFQPHFGAIGGKDPARTVELALYFVAAVARDKILLAGPHAHVTKLSDAELKDELTRLFLGYIGVDERTARRQPRARRGSNQ